MSYRNNTEGRHAELSQLAGAIAGQLPDYEHAQDSAEYRASATIRHKTRPIWFEIAFCWQDPKRIKISGTRPPRWPHGRYFHTPHDYSITCSKNRPADALAADIARRFLTGYAPEYVKNYQNAHKAEQSEKQTAFEREQLRQTFGGTWTKDGHSYHGDDAWTNQETGLKINWSYRERPRFSIETPAGEPAKLLALALRYALQTIQQQAEKDSAA